MRKFMLKNAGKQIRSRELYNKRNENQASSKIKTTPSIIIDKVRTPENLAAIFRLADAVGFKRIVLLDTDLDVKNKKIIRVARDCIKYLEIEHMSLEKFISSVNGYLPIYALEITSTSKSAFDAELRDMCSIVVGNERHGISQELLDICSEAIHIPMYGRNGSMNVAHALAVALYEWRRQINLKIID